MVTREEVVARRQKATDAEIKRVQDICRNVVRSYCNSNKGLQWLAPHVEQQDLVQDCLVGWLEGKNIYYTLQMKCRSLMPINNVTYRKDPDKKISFVEFDESLFASDDDIYNKLLAQDAMDKIKDEKIKFILDAFYILEMSGPEIAKVFDMPKSTVTSLRARGVRIMKGEEI